MILADKDNNRIYKEYLGLLKKQNVANFEIKII